MTSGPDLLAAAIAASEVKRPPPINSKEEAIKWIESLIADCKSARSACDFVTAEDEKGQVTEQQKSWQRYLLRHGVALGVIATFFRMSWITDVQHNAFVMQVRQTMLPTVVVVPPGASVR